ncbi:bifunctional metallophosphatase/5'-nucleotidase [Jeotgalibacillus sp. S-D1]|uniref:bifunctional metallophosphatase/5'-nucleotidase n=1 Tax=Jeotgalibacillus sp. S-D1 TaxID=2552189 RepID=UPI00105A52AF|nr:bifunctional UDP-sugar hydrolase/5'-nucleotidase [Jeotgalibacillus sp. S-D1]TDL35230.1 bifunctional metallophosphatase/5'-nucleotidase [Jeotgalibacillus sp. S-D1]
MPHDRVSITILETSDVHGHIVPIQYADNTEAPVGMARAATYIKKMREKDPELLLIDNGDMIQGTPLTYYYSKYRNHLPNPMITIMNHLQYDCATIGNHEFNFGMGVVSKAVSQSFFPWLSANILHEVTKESYFGYPYTVKEVNGVKVVILGITTHYIPNWENPAHIENLGFEDALLSAKRWVQFIHETEEPGLLIVSYHGGLERDPASGEPTEPLTGENQGYQICQEIDGIDLLLTGHQHRSIAAYINQTYVMQPGCNGQSIGRATVKLKRSGNSWMVEEIEGEVISLENESADEEVMDIIHFQEIETQKWLDRPLGEIKGDMMISNPMEARVKEHPMIEWINRVQMKAANVSISNTALFNNFSKGFPQNVTMRDIVSNYIYPNTLTVLELTKEDIKKALEQSAAYFSLDENNNIAVNTRYEEPKPKHYNYDMWEGINYTIDVAKPVGERIIDLQFKDGCEEPYHVVMNHYRAGGGGDYSMFKGKPVVREILTDMAELLAEDLEQKKQITAEVNNNFTVINSGQMI